jgi:hypothetical protein
MSITGCVTRRSPCWWNAIAVSIAVMSSLNPRNVLDLSQKVRQDVLGRDFDIRIGIGQVFPG